MLTGFVPFEKSEMINICQNQKTVDFENFKSVTKFIA